VSPLLRRGGTEREDPAGPPVVSALVLCPEHAARGHRLAALLRPHVDEVVVAADTKLGDPELEVLDGAGPDRLLRVPFDGRLQRTLEALLREVEGAWAFWVLDDELPTAGVLEVLDAVREGDPDRTSFAFPRAWVWPDGGHVLDARPWWPDLQARLLRTIPALRDVPAPAGASPVVAGPQEIAAAPVLHLALLDAAADAREAAAAQADERPPHPAGAALPDRAAQLTPERRTPPPATRALDPADAAALEEHLREADLPRRRLRGLPRTLSSADLDRWSHGLALPPDRYAGAIEVAEHDLTFTPEVPRGVLVRLENRSSATWPGLDRLHFPVRATYRVLGPDGEAVVENGMRTVLPCDVPPGASRLMEVRVAVPRAGDFTLEIDLVHEFAQWFGIATRVPVTAR